MVTRRKFLMNAAVLTGASFSPFGAAIAFSSGPTQQQHPPDYLDMAVTTEIVAGRSEHISKSIFNEDWLDLSGFSAYQQEALDYLADNVGELGGIGAGFRYLTPEGARTLTSLIIGHLDLLELGRLDEVTAAVLGYWNLDARPLMDISLQMPLSGSTAFALVGRAGSLPATECAFDRSMLLSLPSLSREAAAALRLYPSTLFVRVRNGGLTPDAAAELAHHVGRSLILSLDQPMPLESLRVLASNSEKRVDYTTEQQFSMTYVRHRETPTR